MAKIPEDVFAKIKKIEIVAKESVLDRFSGMYHSVFKGKGIEPDDIREFQPGDDVRDVSWNKTAQMNRPFVKTFREERDLTVIIMVDVSSSLNFQSHFESKRERVAEISALLAFCGVHNHDKVGLILFSNDVEKYIPPRRGERHTIRLIRDLLVYQPTNKGTDIAKALRFLNTVARRRAITFLLSDFIAPSYSKELLLAAKKTDLIPIRISDPEEQELNISGLTSFVDLETGEMKLFDVSTANREEYRMKYNESKNLLSKLANQAGIGIIDISTRGSYLNPILAYFHKRKKKFH